MNKWKGKLAVVTGASGGIGFAIVKDFAKYGINILGLDKDIGDVEVLTKNLGDVAGNVVWRKCDVSDLESVKESFKWIEEKFKYINILINCAGISRDCRILDEDETVTDKLNAVIKTNFTGTVYCTREAFRLMKKSDDYGLIVNTCSVFGHSIPIEGASLNLYAPTKFAVRAFSEVVRHELLMQNSDKIRVTNLSPGGTKTDISRDFVGNKEKFWEKVAHLQPEDISRSVLLLLETPYNVNITELTVKAFGERV